MQLDTQNKKHENSHIKYTQTFRHTHTHTHKQYVIETIRQTH